MKLETERLILREMTMADFDSLYAVLGDSDIMQHYLYSFDEERVRGWINKNIERYRIFGFGLWAVCLKSSGEMVGDCGITMQNINGFIKPEIGYHIRKDMQRNGFAKEAAAAVRDWTFTNTPSAKAAVLWGCSFIEEFADEVNEKTLVYRITRKEWENLFIDKPESYKADCNSKNFTPIDNFVVHEKSEEQKSDC